MKICRHVSASSATEETSKTWQLHSAVCLQRYPLLSAEPKEIEEKFQKHLNEAEVNDSFLSDFEVQEIEER